MLIYLATSNRGKLRDLRSIALSHPDITLELIPETALRPSPEETGDTFEANARLKAAEYSLRIPNAIVLADDSGLEVDALNGAPGVHSARYASTDFAANSQDAANNDKLLRELADTHDANRNARFVCVLALARNGMVTHVAQGTVDGVILRELRGTAGFGYDPLFFLPELNRTFGEISAKQKGAYSHRGRAFRSLLAQLTSG